VKSFIKIRLIKYLCLIVAKFDAKQFSNVQENFKDRRRCHFVIGARLIRNSAIFPGCHQGKNNCHHK
jgi:hypothetical protein